MKPKPLFDFQAEQEELVASLLNLVLVHSLGVLPRGQLPTKSTRFACGQVVIMAI